MRYLIGFLCCSLLSLSSFAATQVAERKHNVGVIAGLGRTNTNDEFASDKFVAQVGAYYDYKINNRYGVQVNALHGGSQCFITCGASDVYVSYTSYQLSLKAMTQFSGRWNLFGRAGADFYRVKYRPDEDDWSYPPNEVRKTLSGVKPAFGLGAQFRAKNGFSLNIEGQYLPIEQGSIRTINGFVGYSF